MEKVVLPELGEGVTEATVSYWYFEEGDKVEEGEDLIEMVTDKATFNVPSSAGGVLKEKCFEEGSVVKVGETLAVLEDQA